MQAPLHILKRKAENPAITMQSLDAQVLKEAYDHLHYRPATARLLGQRNGQRLREVLQKLDIVPFDKNTVDAYKSRVRYGNVKLKLGLGVAGAVASVLAAFAVDPLFVIGAIPSIVATVMSFVMVGRWESEELDRTRQVVPTFALDTAVAIKKLLPEASLGVEYFRTWREIDAMRRELAQDPFLWVAHGDYQAYIEVWDEPKFDAERKA